MYFCFKTRPQRLFLGGPTSCLRLECVCVVTIIAISTRVFVVFVGDATVVVCRTTRLVETNIVIRSTQFNCCGRLSKLVWFIIFHVYRATQTIGRSRTKTKRLSSKRRKHTQNQPPSLYIQIARGFTTRNYTRASFNVSEGRWEGSSIQGWSPAAVSSRIVGCRCRRGETSRVERREDL